MSEVQFEVDGHVFMLRGERNERRILDRHGRQWTPAEVAELVGERRAHVALAYAERDLGRRLEFDTRR